MRVFWGCLRITSRWLVGLSVQGMLILLVLCASLTLICSRILRMTLLLAFLFSWRLSAHLLFLLLPLLLPLLLSLRGSVRFLPRLPSPQLLRLLPLRSFLPLQRLRLRLSLLARRLIRPLWCGWCGSCPFSPYSWFSFLGACASWCASSSSSTSSCLSSFVCFLFCSFLASRLFGTFCSSLFFLPGFGRCTRVGCGCSFVF